MEIDTNLLHRDMEKIRRDLDLIKNILMSEGELTDWAKKELRRARKGPQDSYVSLDVVKKRVLAKK